MRKDSPPRLAGLRVPLRIRVLPSREEAALAFDACAMAMVYAMGESAMLPRAKVIPPREDTNEVEISDIREQVRYWRSQGWRIGQVSADSYQSEALLQMLHADGFAHGTS